MKKFTLALFSVLISLTAFAQTTDVVTDITNLNRILLDGDTLYYSTNSSIFKIDITETTPVPEQLVTGLSSATSMALDGNTLYFAEFSAGRISTIDISEATPTRVTFISGLNTPNFLILDGDFLYYSDNNSDIVERIDITAATPTRELVATNNFNFNPTGLAIQNDVLYMGQGIANRVSTVNVADDNTEPTDFATMINVPLGMRIVDNMLFIVERGDDKISEKDLDSTGPFATDLILALDDPSDLAINDTSIFIAESGANKISKIERTLGVDGFTLNNVSIHPNPAQDFIAVNQLLETAPYTIYDSLGKQIKSGSISPSEMLNISNLASGMYLLQIQAYEAVKFVKR